MTTALRHIEIRIEACGFAIIAIKRCGGEEQLGCFRNRITARDHGLGRAEFWRTKLRDLTAAPVNDTHVRTQQWSPR